MSFFSKMLNAVGFGSDNIEDEEENALTPDADTPAIPAAAPDIPEDEQQMVTRIFDKVLEIVNSSLPDFLAKSVDPQKQKQYMFDALDESVKVYIRSLDQAARQRCETLWQQERLNLQAEMDRLKDQAKQLEDKRNQLTERQLSADRQKRALSERVHDLESQVLKLEAEKEQYELENKSLINKAKVAAVYEKELDELRSAAAAVAPGNTAAVEAANAELNAQITSLKARIEELELENTRLRDGQEAAATKDKMEASMVDELRKIAAESKARVAELEETVSRMQGEHDLLTARLEDAGAREKNLREKAEENNVTQAQLEEISAQVERFAEVKDRLDARIAQLKDNLKKAQTENESLRATIKNNLFQHAAQEKEMRQELESLRERLNMQPPEPKQPTTRRQRMAADADTSEVDDVINNSDFLTSAPDPDRFPAKEESEFGYTAPPRKPKPDNKAQMSLFDE